MGSINPLSSIIQPLTAFNSSLSSALGPLNQATALLQGANLVDNSDDARRQQIRQQDQLALQQLKQQQRLSEQQNAQNAQLERQIMQEETRQANEARQSSLRRAVARQRAEFGGSGISSSSGSAQAVLLGLFEESDEEREERERLDNLRSSALDQSASQLQSRNVLEATQAAQRNQLQSISGSNNGFFGTFF